MDLNEDANNNEMDLDGDAIKAINLGFIDEIFPSDSKAKVSFLLHFSPAQYRARDFEQMIEQKFFYCRASPYSC